ncbi:MAG: nucleotidyltransferase family protein [Clostridia bacterium]|nr:nucleotidyltransferase family protein [Clostridia bacterium]
MKTVAIICEYNPFTNGHLHHLTVAKSDTNADTVICVMSGSFTQRGDAAVLDKYDRAEIAVRMGADMVVELPLIYSISPADNFAFGAIRLISNLPGIEYLSFGSECGDIALLEKTADFLSNEPEQYKQCLSQFLSQGLSYPKARSLALSEYAKLNPEFTDISAILDGANNTLAVCYIQAIRSMGLQHKIKLHTIKRISNYNDTDIHSEYPSAGAIRKAVAVGKLEEVKKAVPDLCYNHLRSVKIGGTPLGDLCLFKIKDISGYDLEKYYDVIGGLHNRIKLAALSAVTYEQFLENAKTKRYTMARLKRISLYVLFDITQDFFDESKNLPPYIFVLAMKKDRKDILAELNANEVNVLVKYSDIEKVDKRLRPYIKLDFKAQGVLNMINRNDYTNRKMILI